MNSRDEPESVAPIVRRVLADIRVAWERHHGKPVPEFVREMIDGDETPDEIPPCRRSARGPPFNPAAGCGNRRDTL